MSEAKQIKIACGSGIEMMLEDIIDLQGNLKELTDEKRRALTAWEGYLSRVIGRTGGDNVLTLRKEAVS